MISKILKLIVPNALWHNLREQKEKRLFKAWQVSDLQGPTPHIAKRNIIKEYQKKYGCLVLVETGTYRGDMVEAQKLTFKKVISIELGLKLFKNAQKRFINDKNVVIMQGDSGRVLPIIMKDLVEPTIFWLDGHYSAGITAKGDKECPIFEELDAIFQGKKLNHILLIDDAQSFNGSSDYPTIKQLTEYIKSKNPKYQIEVKHDVIRYVIAGS